ncbi:CapA family protein [Ammoniphilus sp. CFH 90114]|uniref:CapA family protein n=1 Tax=Ammoniphilus sp. CFH 90114 TaxID=2493665 RepID=UPI00100F2F11|nr:CapA family protein [Ammoniphilus sp. CFH 90114]RXT13522.1 CapA family protein [Ammoniphilus sp. CFH 90114]
MKKTLGILFFAVLWITGCSTQGFSPGQDTPDILQEKIQSQQEQKPATPSLSDETIPENISPIVLSFAGDTMMAGRVADIVKQKGRDYPFTDSAPIFQESDLSMLNVETAISTKGDAKQKEYTFRSDPLMADALKKAGIDIVTVANNHALDYGTEAFLDTLDYLQRAGIDYVGGGKNQEEAYAPIRMEVKGKTLSIFAFSRVLAEANWHAGIGHPGMASAYDPELVYRSVQPHIEQSDYTIVYLHWGQELAEQPLPYQVQLAHGLIDLGVDLVIGSHPHVLQGLEWYKGKLIAYSLGNFVFTTSRVPEGRQSGILQVTLEGDEIVPRFIPMHIDQGAVWLADEGVSGQIMERLNRLSSGGTWQDQTYHKK